MTLCSRVLWFCRKEEFPVLLAERSSSSSVYIWTFLRGAAGALPSVRAPELPMTLFLNPSRWTPYCGNIFRNEASFNLGSLCLEHSPFWYFSYPSKSFVFDDIFLINSLIYFCCFFFFIDMLLRSIARSFSCSKEIVKVYGSTLVLDSFLFDFNSLLF